MTNGEGTESTRISRIPRSRKPVLTPEQRRRKRSIQIGLGVLVGIVVLVLAFFAQQQNPHGAVTVLVGVGLGYTLQRSRFCFTASLRDPVLTGGTELTKAVILGFFLCSLLFMGLNLARFGSGLESLELSKVAGNVKPVGVHTALGAFLFGIGAVIAGGCASGTLMRMGEGFAQQWLAFGFFVVGSMLGTYLLGLIKTVPFLYSGNTVFLPETLGGWIPAVILQFGALLLLYIAADAWSRKKSGGM